MTQSNEKNETEENIQLSTDDYIKKISKDTNIPLELITTNLISSLKEYSYRNALVEKTIVRITETRYHGLNVRGMSVTIHINKDGNRLSTWMRGEPFIGIYLFDFSRYETITKDVFISALKANDLWSDKYHPGCFSHIDKIEENEKLDDEKLDDEKKLNFREQVHKKVHESNSL